MTLNLLVCQDCRASHFPARLRCHQCGGARFGKLPVADATVRGVTRVHRIPPGCEFAYLVEVETAGGVPLVAATASAVTPGQRVPLAQRSDGAIVIPQPSTKEST